MKEQSKNTMLMLGETQNLAPALVMSRYIELKDRPTELACNQECLAFQQEKQQVVQTFGYCFDLFFRELLLRADSDPGGVNFYIFVPSLGLPTGFRYSTAEKKAL